MIPATALFPNALLIIAALDSRDMIADTCSPKTWQVASWIGENASWVHRYGAQLRGDGWVGSEFDKGYASLSPNGHCWLEDAGRVIGRELREASPPEPVNEVYGCLRLNKDGSVLRWVPDYIPGFDRAPVPPRSERAQHKGRWISIIGAGQFCGRYWRGACYETNGPVATTLQDGSAPHRGMSVILCRFAARGSPGESGKLLAYSNGSAIVRFPSEGIIALPARSLLRPGAIDSSDLTEAQLTVFKAIGEGQAMVSIGVDGTPQVSVNGRRVLPRTLQALIEKKLVSPEGVAATSA